MPVNGDLSSGCLIYDGEIHYNVLVPPESRSV